MAQRQPKALAVPTSSKSEAAIVVGYDGELYAWNEAGDETPLTGGTVGTSLGKLANELRNEIVGTEGTVRYLKGYTTAHDGGQGEFQWSNSPAVDDGGTALNVGNLGSNMPGWRRVFSGPLDVRWFGADATGASDSAAAVQHAINAVPNGGSLYLPRGIYACNGALTVTNNLTIIGDGQAHISGFTTPQTILRDTRTNPGTPFLTFGPDSLGLPTSRGCTVRHLYFDFPSAGKTDYSILLDGTTGTAFYDCTFAGANNGSGVPTPGGGDPGLIRHLAYEQAIYDHCTFHYGSVQLSFAGTGAGGLFTARDCWFYDCNAEHIKCSSNGDACMQLDNCAFDPIYRTTLPVTGVDLRCNGFSIRNTSFYGFLDHQPTGTYLNAVGTGVIEGCRFNTQTVAITASGNIRIDSNVIQAYCGVRTLGGGVTVGKGNRFTPAQVPDNSASLEPFKHKRAVIVNEPYTAACVVDLGPDVIESVTGADLTISTAGNSSPIPITTTTAHGLATDDWVFIAGVTGNSGALGRFQITKTGTNTFTLQGSTATGAGTGGTATPLWFFWESYHVGEPGFAQFAAFQTGTIHHSRSSDSSSADGGASAPSLKLAALVRLDPLDPIVMPLGDTQTPRHCDVSPHVLNNEGFTGAVGYNLPPLHPSLKYTFQKRPDLNTSPFVTPKMTITAATSASKTITGATHDANDIIIHCVGHGFADGTYLLIDGVGGNTIANGYHWITVNDADHFTLNGVKGNADYTTGGTAQVVDKIYMPGATDGVLAIENADPHEYNAKVTLEAKYRYRTDTGRDEIRWYVSDMVGSWVGASGTDVGFMPLAGKRSFNNNLGDANPHIIGTLTVPTDREIYVTATYHFRKNDGAFYCVQRGAFFQRLSGTLSIDGTVDTIGTDHPSVAPVGWSVDITSSGDDIQFKATAVANVSVQVDVKWDEHI